MKGSRRMGVISGRDSQSCYVGVEGEKLVLLGDWRLKHWGGLGAKGLGLGGDGASGLWVLTTKTGMQQRL